MVHFVLARRVSDDNEKTRFPFDSVITMKDNANVSAFDEVRHYKNDAQNKQGTRQYHTLNDPNTQNTNGENRPSHTTLPALQESSYLLQCTSSIPILRSLYGEAVDRGSTEQAFHSLRT